MQIQYSVHWAHDFLHTHLEQLLPDWSVPVLSVLVVLQMSQLILLERTSETETQKQRLRERFIEIGCTVASKLSEVGHLAEVFDPQTGWPLLSKPGQLKLDDTAVVQACLGYQLIDSGGCSVLQHPVWGSAVYPSILISSARPEVIEPIVRQVLTDSTNECYGFSA